MIDFSSQKGPKIDPKSLPKRFQRVSEGALDEDSDSKLKKERSEFIAGAAAELRPSTNWRVLGPHGGGKQGGGIVLTRLTALGQAQGSADMINDNSSCIRIARHVER